MYSSAYVWAKVLGYLEDRLTTTLVSSWFDDADVVELNDEQLIISTGSAYRREMIAARCKDHIKDAMKSIFNSTVEIVVFGPEELKEYRSKGQDKPVMEFNPQFTFDNFIVGSTNRFAHAAAQAVAQGTGQAYNPLFIYGPSGMGKTHLLYAIANETRKRHPNFKIVYIKGDQFTIELIAALAKGKNVEFRSKYREADLFLIDDIQFIAGKDSTQEEFFHTFNSLYEAGKQIVMTADRKPNEMATLEDRLRTRFEWGLIADIQPPDFETRMAILQRKAQAYGLKLPADVSAYIVTNVTNNVRQIEGTVKKLSAYMALDEITLDVPSVSRAISDMYKVEGNAVPTPGLIITQVCSYYSVDENALRSTLKNKGTAEARQIAMYMIRKITTLSLPDIGKEFGRDHSTVLHSIRKVEAALKDSGSPLHDAIRDITANINSAL